MISYIIYLLCCGLTAGICAHLFELSDWKYWVFILMPVITWFCGNAYAMN